jgi:hypothetical protein
MQFDPNRFETEALELVNFAIYRFQKLPNFYSETKFCYYLLQGKAISPKQTYAISRFLAKIFPVPISPKFFEIYIKNYFKGVINDVILKIDFPKFTLFNFNLTAFGGVLNSTHFGASLHSNLL